MRAFVVSALTEDLSNASLTNAPDPQSGRDNVLVRIRAAGVSYVDILHARGKHKPTPPYVPDSEIAGDVVAISDAVWGSERAGGFSEYGLASAAT